MIEAEGILQRDDGEVMSLSKYALGYYYDRRYAGVDRIKPCDMVTDHHE